MPRLCNLLFAGWPKQTFTMLMKNSGVNQKWSCTGFEEILQNHWHFLIKFKITRREVSSKSDYFPIGGIVSTSHTFCIKLSFTFTNGIVNQRSRECRIKISPLRITSTPGGVGQYRLPELLFVSPHCDLPYSAYHI